MCSITFNCVITLADGGGGGGGGKMSDCSGWWLTCFPAVSKKRGHGREVAQLLNCSKYDG